MTDGFVLGVDLGTSHTVAMLRRPDGRTRPLLFDGQPLLPSAVFLDAAGHLHVGRDAVRLGHAEPGRLEPNPKRRVDAETVLLGGAEVPAADLLAALLGAVAREAVAATGFLPPAVLTYPAAWGERRRAVLTEALSQAGWPSATRLIPEPVAAARYFADVLRRPVPVGSALAVFDFGGGTLDIAVVRHEGAGPDGRSRFAVAASGGIDDLGGLDLDAALVQHLGRALAREEPAAWGALTDPVTLAQWRARRQFWDDVRGAKEMLSRTASAPVPVPGVEHAVQLTRDELETVAAPLIRRGVAEAATVIAAAGLKPADLAGLFLVGGSSRVPLVARLLHGDLGAAPTVLEQPELPVAEGATIAVAEASAASSAGVPAPAPGSSPPADPAPADAPTASPAAPGPPADARRIADGPAAGTPAEARDAETPAGTMRPAPVEPLVDTMTHDGPAEIATEVESPRRPETVPGRPVSPPPRAAGPDRSPEPQYAEPVDPWATGEAAAFGNAGHGPVLHPTSGAPGSSSPGSPHPGPWLASAQDQDEAGGDAKVPAYRRKGLWIVAAATVVVVGVAAALAVVFWPGYPALDYRPLTDLRRFPPPVPVTSAFNQTAVREGRAYFAAADENGLLGIVAAETGSGKVAWRNTAAGSATRWEYLFALPDAVVAITDTDSTSGLRRMILLDAGSGAKRWERAVGANDSLLFADGIIVLVDRTENRLLGLEIKGGKARWEQRTPQTQYGLSSTNVVAASTEGDFSGAAGIDGVPFAGALDDDQRIVQISADESARVLDAGTGKVVGQPRAGVADPNDTVIAHHGRLIVIESGSNTKRLVSYDLEKLGAQPDVLYVAPDSGTDFEGLTACGKDRVCLIETAGSDAKTAKVVAVDAAEGGDLWKLAVPDVDEIAPVGESLLATLNTSPPQVTLVSAAGKKAWTRAGVAGRLDAGNVLQFSKVLSTSADDPGLSGQHLGDDPVPLGSLADVRTSSCSWDAAYLACVADADFVLQRFAD